MGLWFIFFINNHRSVNNSWVDPPQRFTVYQLGSEGLLIAIYIAKSWIAQSDLYVWFFLPDIARRLSSWLSLGQSFNVQKFSWIPFQIIESVRFIIHSVRMTIWPSLTKIEDENRIEKWCVVTIPRLDNENHNINHAHNLCQATAQSCDVMVKIKDHFSIGLPATMKGIQLADGNCSEKLVLFMYKFPEDPQVSPHIFPENCGPPICSWTFGHCSA